MIVELDNEFVDILPGVKAFGETPSNQVEHRFMGLLVNEVDFLDQNYIDDEEEEFKDVEIESASEEYYSDEENTAERTMEKTLDNLSATNMFDKINSTLYNSVAAGMKTSRHKKNKISFSGMFDSS
jgi:hypothetical protein